MAGPPQGAQYAGDKVCGSCHISKAEIYKTTPMYGASVAAADSTILREHPHLTFQQGPYHYEIVREGNRSIYSVNDGHQTISAPIIWAFGKARAGQTYILRLNGAYYESRVSFFKDTQALDLTLGAPRKPPQSLQEAFGLRMEGRIARDCIACHTSRAVIGGEFHPAKAVPGIHCEKCHGPGTQHIAKMRSGQFKDPAIFNPGKLPPRDIVAFCGLCHGSSMQIESKQLFDIRNVRFQAYRLEGSRCWNPMDARITCLACHDPHQPLVRDAASYDSKCLACHVKKGSRPDSKHPGAACPVSDRRCVTCHMPRYELPGGHHKFVDHEIRVVRPGEPYPG